MSDILWIGIIGFIIFALIIGGIIGVYYYVKNDVFLANGAECRLSIECQSGWCTGNIFDSGTCQPVIPKGQPCLRSGSNDQCGGTECGAIITDQTGDDRYICCPSGEGTNPLDSDKEYCTLYSGPGGFCYDDEMCALGLSCSVSNASGDPGICR